MIEEMKLVATSATTAFGKCYNTILNEREQLLSRHETRFYFCKRKIQEPSRIHDDVLHSITVPIEILSILQYYSYFANAIYPHPPSFH
jgi:hypothetical protein